MVKKKEEVRHETLLVPQPKIRNEHWKVGDGMRVNGKECLISQMALVLIERTHDVAIYEIQFYDEYGNLIGSIKGLEKQL